MKNKHSVTLPSNEGRPVIPGAIQSLIFGFCIVILSASFLSVAGGFIHDLIREILVMTSLVIQSVLYLLTN